MSNKDWNDYFMSIAQVVAERSTCNRLKVGAVVVNGKRLLSTGYNGSLSGAVHCSEGGHDIDGSHCVRTVHAEANAILWAARFGVAIGGSTIYITHAPCFPCFKHIAGAGIVKICYGEIYKTLDSRIDIYVKDIGGHHYKDQKVIYLTSSDPNGRNAKV